MFVSVYRTITVCAAGLADCTLCQNTFTFFFLQCRTDTLSLPNLIVCMQQSYCLIQSSFTHSCRSEISPITNVSLEHVYKIFFLIKVLSLNILGSNGEWLFISIALSQQII